MVDEADFARRIPLCQDAVSATDHPYHLGSFNGGRGSLHSLEAADRPDHTLARTIIRFDDVVQGL